MVIISHAEARYIGDEVVWCDIVEAIDNDDAVNAAEAYAAEVVANFKLDDDLFYANAINKLANMIRSGDHPDVADAYFAAGFSA